MGTFIALMLSLAFLGPVIMVVAAIAIFGFWIYTIIVVLNAERGDEKTSWLLVVIFLSLIGCVLYHFMRPQKSNGAGRTMILIAVGLVMVIVVGCCGLSFLPIFPDPNINAPVHPTPAGQQPQYPIDLSTPAPTRTLITAQGLLTEFAATSEARTATAQP